MKEFVDTSISYCIYEIIDKRRDSIEKTLGMKNKTKIF